VAKQLRGRQQAGCGMHSAAVCWCVGMVVCRYACMLVCWYGGMLVCWYVLWWYVGMVVCWYVVCWWWDIKGQLTGESLAAGQGFLGDEAGEGEPTHDALIVRTL
jgi:hypothetical protein